MDNYGTLKTATIRRRLARNPRFHVHLTPTSASGLSQAERWFATRTERRIRPGTRRSIVELERAIREYLAVNHRDPEPFVWTKTADPILASIERFCVRTPESGHPVTARLLLGADGNRLGPRRLGQRPNSTYDFAGVA